MSLTQTGRNDEVLLADHGNVVQRALAWAGCLLTWIVARQRGSHIVLVKEDQIASLSVPDHREVAQGTLRSLIRSAGLTVSEFLAAQNQG